MNKIEKIYDQILDLFEHSNDHTYDMIQYIIQSYKPTRVIEIENHVERFISENTPNDKKLLYSFIDTSEKLQNSIMIFKHNTYPKEDLSVETLGLISYQYMLTKEYYKQKKYIIELLETL